MVEIELGGRRRERKEGVEEREREKKERGGDDDYFVSVTTPQMSAHFPCPISATMSTQPITINSPTRNTVILSIVLC